MYILELYQNVIEERDVLSREVIALGDELERARQALLSADQHGAELEARLAAAAEENQRLRAENVDLAGRLTTAQIRRLQAEKILLEQRLAEIGTVPPAGSRQQP
jgi:regulator of replication initiation timing